MQKHNIVLIGMMGTFKSSAGAILARMLDMHFADTDEFLRFEYNMSIAEVFRDYGEDFFRELESAMVRRLSKYKNVVISTGGGVVLREENMRHLIKSGYIVLLTADAKTIYERVKDSDERPLLSGDKQKRIRSIVQERDAAYRKYADIIVDNTELDPEQTAERIAAELAKLLSSEQ